MQGNKLHSYAYVAFIFLQKLLQTLTQLVR